MMGNMAVGFFKELFVNLFDRRILVGLTAGKRSVMSKGCRSSGRIGLFSVRIHKKLRLSAAADTALPTGHHFDEMQIQRSVLHSLQNRDHIFKPGYHTNLEIEVSPLSKRRCGSLRSLSPL